MKKKKFNSKLSLNKETISRLQDSEMNKIMGGADGEAFSFFCGTTLVSRTCDMTFAGETCGAERCKSIIIKA